MVDLAFSNETVWSSCSNVAWTIQEQSDPADFMEPSHVSDSPPKMADFMESSHVSDSPPKLGLLKLGCGRSRQQHQSEWGTFHTHSLIIKNINPVLFPWVYLCWIIFPRPVSLCVAYHFNAAFSASTGEADRIQFNSSHTNDVVQQSSNQCSAYDGTNNRPGNQSSIWMRIKMQRQDSRMNKGKPPKFYFLIGHISP